MITIIRICLLSIALINMTADAAERPVEKNSTRKRKRDEMNIVGSFYLSPTRSLIKASKLPLAGRKELNLALNSYPINENTELCIVTMRLLNKNTNVRVEKEMFLPYTMIQDLKDCDTLCFSLWGNICYARALSSGHETFYDSVQRLAKQQKK